MNLSFALFFLLLNLWVIELNANRFNLSNRKKIYSGLALVMLGLIISSFPKVNEINAGALVMKLAVMSFAPITLKYMMRLNLIILKWMNTDARTQRFSNIVGVKSDFLTKEPFSVMLYISQLTIIFNEDIKAGFMGVMPPLH